MEVRLFSFLTPLRHTTLILRLARREVSSRYRGSFLGLAWSLITPLIMLGIYTFVFSQVFKIRWGSLEEGTGEFALRLFSGLIVFNFFAENINRAPNLILENPSYVKKVVFPLEILPVTQTLSACFNAATSSLVLILGIFVMGRDLGAAMLYLVPIWCALIVVTWGIGWFLAGLGVYLRDLRHVVSMGLTILLFLTPIFYPVTALPARLQKIIYLNPLAFFVEQNRNIFMANQPPDLLSLAIAVTASCIVAWGGFRLFEKMRKGFSDVL